MEELLGKTLDGTYRIDQILGRGGMGAVYRGHDVSLDRDVAIKVMHPHFADDASFCERFRQEARAIASLNHPGIVQVFACGQDLGVLYIVMDLVRGQTLDQWMRRLSDNSKIVATAESLRIVRSVATALHYAHEKGVLHRDVKPANIILRPIDPALQEPGDLPFHPVLTDFGLAKLAEGSLHTMTGITLGTPTYMSPEQCRGLDPDRRSDIYSLGIVLYELTTGHVPFAVKSITDAIRCHTEEPPPPPRSTNPALSVEVEAIVLRALAKRPEDRFATARELADAIRAVIAPPSGGLILTPARVGDQRSPAGPAVYTAASTGAFARALSITLPDGQVRQASLQARQTLSVGRTDENDLHLPDNKVSRHHARIAFDGRDLVVTDLHSTNGTFLGDTKLLPGIPEPWSLDQPLCIGDTVLRLARHPAKQRADHTVVDVRQGTTGAGGGAIGVSTERFAIEVDPGGHATTAFTLMNAGPRVDHLETTIEGVPDGWIAERPPVVRLLPDDRKELSVTFAPPRTPQSRAGSYPVTIRIASQADPTQVSEIRGTLRVTAYYGFSLDLHPRKQTGFAKGTFEVQLANQGNADLDVQLTAADPEEGCQYTFSPVRVTVAAGGQHTAQLTARPRIPLPGEMTRSYLFTATARPEEAPDLVQEVQGQWVQIAPSLEAQLHPQRQQGTDGATFRVQVANQSLADIEVTLQAADAGSACRYTFQPSPVTVPAAGDCSVQLDVRPRETIYGQESIRHPFTVTVQPAGAARFARQVQGAWTQMPLQRSLWPPALLLIAGWIAAWVTYWVPLQEILFGVLVESVASTGIPWEVAEIVPWAIRGIGLGLIGGGATGLALRWAEPAFRWGQVIWIAVVWAIAWGAGVAAAPITGLPFEGGLVAVVFWIITGGIVGAVGGLFTGAALRRACAAPRGGFALAAALGWTLGWAAGEGAAEWIVQSGLAEQANGAVWIVLAVLIGAVGSAIGGGITLGQLNRARRIRKT